MSSKFVKCFYPIGSNDNPDNQQNMLNLARLFYALFVEVRQQKTILSIRIMTNLDLMLEGVTTMISEKPTVSRFLDISSFSEHHCVDNTT